MKFAHRTRARLNRWPWLFLTVFACAMLGVGGCAVLEKDADQASKPDLQIPEMTTFIGSKQGDTDEQVVSYIIHLLNTSAGPIHVKWVEPLLSDAFAMRVLSLDHRQAVDVTLAPEEGMEISGELVFDAHGLSKDQILDLEPFMSGMNVASERVLALPGP